MVQCLGDTENEVNQAEATSEGADNLEFVGDKANDMPDESSQPEAKEYS